MPRRDQKKTKPLFTPDDIGGMVTTETVERFVGKELSRDSSDVIVEGLLTITAGGVEMVRLTASPGSWDELSIGFLFFHGVAVSPTNVVSIAIDEDGRGATVDIDAAPEDIQRALGRGVGVSLTDDHRTIIDGAHARAKTSPDITMTSDRIFFLMRLLEEHSAIHDRTHGSHIALLVDGDEVVAARSDISRRSAIDKVAGYTLINNIASEGGVLLSSGRVAEDIVARARMMGISALVSRSAATDRGVQSARDAGLLLVGLTRNGSFLVYSGQGRVSG